MFLKITKYSFLFLLNVKFYIIAAPLLITDMYCTIDLMLSQDLARFVDNNCILLFSLLNSLCCYKAKKQQQHKNKSRWKIILYLQYC